MNRRFLDDLSLAMADVYAAVTDQLLVNLARHFKLIKGGKVPGSWDYQVRKLAEMGQVTKESRDIILKMLGDADGALKNVLEQAIMDGLKDADPILRKAAEKGFITGVASGLAPNQMQAFQMYYQQSADKLNLVNTVMLESTQQAYQSTVADIVSKIDTTQKILNTATGEIITGVDPFNKVLRQSVRKMVNNGLTGFIDHGGHHWSPEAYVAMDMRTTMTNTAREAVAERSREMGCDLYQVSSHNGARPLCYPWQGKVISRNGWTGVVEDFEGNKITVHSEDEIESFRYGGGLFGVNCGHYPIPFVPGFSRSRPPQQDEEANAKEYAESQEQRRLERELRGEKRELAVMKAQGATEEEITAQKARITQANNNLDSFCDSTGRARRKEREYTPVNATWPDGYQQTQYGAKNATHMPTPATETPVTSVKQVEIPKERTLNESLADAYEYHRTANNLTSAPYDPDSELKFITDDLSKLGEESRKVAEKTISDLSSKYDTPLTSVRTMNKQETLLYRNAFATTGHNYSNDTAEIMINPVKCADNAKLVERIRELRDKNYCAFVPDDALERYIVTHEFGHSLLAMNNAPSAKINFVGIDIKKLTSIQEQVRSVFKEYCEEIGQLEKARRSAELRFIRDIDETAASESRALAKQISGIKISEYSLTSADEFFAESFTFTEYGGTGNAYANRIREIINQYFLR